jgi:hypothetical protein
MIVCAHGEVSEYCENRDMIIVERFTGEIENYCGVCRVLVTDREMSSGEYYYLKGKMLAQGIELVSTRYVDSENLNLGEIKSRPGGGRPKFGDRSDAERAVVDRIFELRDSGATYKEISEDAAVGYPDGRKMSVSTIQVILRNREKY